MIKTCILPEAEERRILGEGGKDMPGAKHLTMKDRIYEEIVRMITTGELPPGSAIDERKLAQDFDLPDGVQVIRLRVTHPRTGTAWAYSVDCPT